MDKPNRGNKSRNPKFSGNFGKKIGKTKSANISNRAQTVPIKSYKDADEFNLYLPEEKYEENGSIKVKLEAVEEYLSYISYSSLLMIDEKKYFTVDINSISKNKIFSFRWPEFMHDLINSPQLVIGLFGLAMERLIKKKNARDYKNSNVNDEFPYIPLRKINPRFIGWRSFIHFQDLKSHNFGKFVTLMGTVVRVSDIKPICTHLAFMCLKCQTIQVIVQERGCYTPPNRCIGEKCFCCTFKPCLNSPSTHTIPMMNMRLQELNIDQTEGGRVPRTVECELTCDLTDSCIPGDVVVVSGVVIASNINQKQTAFGRDACTYLLSISANSVTCLKGKSTDVDVTADGIEFKPEDLSAIQQIHSEKELFRLIVASLCPNIFGHELIKAGLVLGLFGGRESSRKNDETKEFCIRSNSHILIVGDPGLGKSQMLLACSNVSPRGVYVCGNSTTTSGLTVTINKDGEGGNCLEAGALVLADQGHCCIDEFDKMVHQHSALLEAMEQQTISVAKSGVVCTLPARTSIIAAANPSGGHYSKAKTVSENIKIGGSLLSRFDLVFIVQDKPNKELDSRMSEHVMALHTVKHTNDKAEDCMLDNFIPSTSSTQHDTLYDKSQLLYRLQMKPGEKLNIITPAMLQKYISYARKFAQPKHTPEVCEILQTFYLDMRKQHKLSYSTPITTRQLESLIRLTEARARVELRPFCTVNDAEEVIEIMKYSMRETYSDEFGNIDFERSIHGSGMSKRSQAKRLITALTKAAKIKRDDCFTISEMKELAKNSKISLDSFDCILDSLNDQGFLLKKGYLMYQIKTL